MSSNIEEYILEITAEQRRFKIYLHLLELQIFLFLNAGKSEEVYWKNAKKLFISAYGTLTPKYKKLLQNTGYEKVLTAHV